MAHPSYLSNLDLSGYHPYPPFVDGWGTALPARDSPASGRYTPTMTITLDENTEKLLERELQRGRFADANELIAHALHLVEAEQPESHQAQLEDWLTRNREAVRKALAESCAARDRGEAYTPEEVKAHFAERRAARSRHAA